MSHTDQHHDKPSPRELFGTAAFYVGLGLLVLIVIDSTAGLPIRFPRSWYQHRYLWVLISLASQVAGWILQSPRRDAPPEWRPDEPGRRFARLVVYSRPECHLCDDAKDILAQYAEYLPEIEDVDIDGDPQLVERFGTSIPVVEIDGQIRFRGRVDEVLLRRLIEGTKPD